MLKRLYVDNFRSLTNFELELKPFALLMGPNGAGKSAVFDVLSRVRGFVTQDGRIEACFPLADLTRWYRGAQPIQTFELAVEGNGGAYLYRLTVEHAPDRGLARVGKESLSFDGKPLFEFAAETGHARLYRDDHSEGPEYPFDWTRSGIGSLLPRHDNRRLTWFKTWLGAAIVARMDPMNMGAETRRESATPSPDLSDYAAWFQYLSQERQGQVFDLTAALREVLPDFEAFSLRQAGEARVLWVSFGKGSERQDFKLYELSDGQRALIALYTLLYCLPEAAPTLCVDEPENFLALPEIQPWLDEVYARSSEGQMQCLLVSHHPRAINALAETHGVWLDRAGQTQPTRVKPIVMADALAGLPVSQLVERGWIVDA
jgi:ABC-type branched-subunit amino acid transport system ATPase component